MNEMLKIDFERLKNVQKKNSESVSLQTLEHILKIVLNFSDTSYKLAPNNVQLALNTLKDLKVIVEESSEKPEVQQLNS